MTTPLPLDVHNGLRELAGVFSRRGTNYAVIGGVAAGILGQARFTEDIDVLVDVPQLQLPSLLQDLNEAGFQGDLHASIRDWNQGGMLQLRYNDVRVDWLKPVLPCFAHLLTRARLENWQGTQIRLATVEDLIVMKLLAQRSQDLFDVESLLIANRGNLDIDLVRHELAANAPDDTATSRLDELLAKHYSD